MLYLVLLLLPKERRYGIGPKAHNGGAAAGHENGAETARLNQTLLQRRQLRKATEGVTYGDAGGVCSQSWNRCVNMCGCVAGKV